MTRFRRAGWKVLFFPGAEVVHVGGASHGGTLVRREPARPPALVRQASRREGGRARAPAAAALAAPARARAAPRASIARACASSRPATPARCSRSDRLPPPRLRHAVRAAAGLGRRARARAAQRLGGARVDARRASSSPGRPCSRCTARSTSPSLVLARDLRRRARGAGASRTRFAPRAAFARAGWLVGVVLGWSLWHVEGVVTGDGLFHEARVRKLVDLTAPAPAHRRRVQGRRAASRLRVPALARLPRARRVVLGRRSRAWSCATSRRCSRRSRAPSTWEAGVAVFGSRCGGRRRSLVASLAVFCFGPGTAARTRRSRCPATAARQLLVPGGDRALLHRVAPGRLRALAAIFGALALAHPTYALFLLVPLAASRSCARWEWRNSRPARRARADGARPALAEADRRRDDLAQPRPGRAAARDSQHYGDQLVVRDEHHFRLAPEVFGRSGAVAVAALILLPLVGARAPAPLGGLRARRAR